jgi:methanogen homocitrate synthase
MITVFSRAAADDIDKAVAAGAQGIILEVPSGYPRIKNQFPKWSYDDVKNKAIEGVKYAKSKGLYVIFFPYDTTRAEIDFLETLYKEVVDKGKPDSVAIIDTIGCALPQTIFYLVRKVKSWVNLPVEVHTHNDFGMGVATSLAGVEAGAEVVHGCLTGIGERTGNASLEQIIVALKTLLGMDVNINIKELYKVCQKISELSNVPIPRNAPITGDVAFAREIGLGAKLFKTAPTTIFPLNPAFLNRKPKIVLGKKSGKDSIKIKIEELNLEVNEEKILDILDKVKTFSIKKGSYLTDDEFIGIVNETNNN